MYLSEPDNAGLKHLFEAKIMLELCFYLFCLQCCGSTLFIGHVSEVCFGVS